jgi:hypothetical protein
MMAEVWLRGDGIPKPPKEPRPGDWWESLQPWAGPALAAASGFGLSFPLRAVVPDAVLVAVGLPSVILAARLAGAPEWLMWLLLEFFLSQVDIALIRPLGAGALAFIAAIVVDSYLPPSTPARHFVIPVAASAALPLLRVLVILLALLSKLT